MSDKLKIIAGLAVFVVLATFPLWYMRVAGGVDTPPDLEPPAGALLFTADWATVGGGDGVDLRRLGNAFGMNMIVLTGQASLVLDEDEGKWWVVDGENRYLVMKKDGMAEIYAGCVEDKAYMNPNHMNILNEWREDVVRKGDRSKVEINGREYEKSLTKCCLKCHTSREKFCVKCHEYADVLPPEACPVVAGGPRGPRGINCWDCHVELKGD